MWLICVTHQSRAISIWVYPDVLAKGPIIDIRRDQMDKAIDIPDSEELKDMGMSEASPCIRLSEEPLRET